MNARTRYSVVTLATMLAVTVSVQIVSAQLSGASDIPSPPPPNNQQFSISTMAATPSCTPTLNQEFTTQPWSDGAPLTAPLLCTADVYNISGTDHFLFVRPFPGTSPHRISYTLSAAITGDAAKKETFEKAICAWNQALGTPCNSDTSFLYPGATQRFGSHPAAVNHGIEMDVQESGTQGLQYHHCQGSYGCRSRIIMNSDNWVDYNEEFQTYAVVHEIGHALGLDHTLHWTKQIPAVVGGGTYSEVQWRDCAAVMAYKNGNCISHALNPSHMPTAYEVQAVKSFYNLS